MVAAAAVKAVAVACYMYSRGAACGYTHCSQGGGAGFLQLMVTAAAVEVLAAATVKAELH